MIGKLAVNAGQPCIDTVQITLQFQIDLLTNNKVYINTLQQILKTNGIQEIVCHLETLQFFPGLTECTNHAFLSLLDNFIRGRFSGGCKGAQGGPSVQNWVRQYTLLHDRLIQSFAYDNSPNKNY